MTPKPALLGIDLGTSSIKVGAFDLSGRLLALARAQTPTDRLPGGWAEHDPEQIWVATARLVAEVVGGLTEHTIEAVATASVGEAGVPVDASGRAVRPAIAWFDSRAQAESDWWAKSVGTDLVTRISGQPIDASYSASKLLWIRRHEPDAFAATRRWLSLADVIVYRLCGEFFTDQSLASRTMLFDQRTLSWSDELISLGGFSRALFPPALPGGTRIGGVSGEASTLTGLRRGTPVVLGGHDRLCAAFATRGGQDVLIDSIGSAEAIVVPVTNYVERTALEAGSVSCYADVVPGRYVMSARVGYAGALLDWFQRDLLGEPLMGNQGALTLDEQVPWPLSWSGLLVYASFGRVLTPEFDPSTAYGTILGLTLAHKKHHVLQALCEGVAYSLRTNIEWLEHLTDQPISTVRVEGGFTRSRVWMQLNADVTGRQIEGCRVEEATALGAALLGGVGAGIFANCQVAGEAVALDIETWSPDRELHATYSRVYNQGYRHIRKQLSDFGSLFQNGAH